MSDLINRQDAIMHFVKASENYECGIFSLAEVTHELWEIPSAQRKGKWLDRTDDGRIVYPWWARCECSQCENEGYEAWEFCPNCGADMRGEIRC